MNLKELRRIFVQIEESMAINTCSGVGLITLDYHEDCLWISWSIWSSGIRILLPCKVIEDGIESLAVGIYFDEVDDFLHEVRECPDTAEVMVKVSPDEMQITVENFSFHYVDFVDIPDEDFFNGNGCERYLTSFNSTELNALLAATYVAGELSSYDDIIIRFPHLRGVNLNCFSDIIEIGSLNMKTVMYRYIHGSKRLEKPISFTIAPEAIFAIAGLVEEATEIQIYVDLICECIVFKIEELSTSVATKIIRGVFSYPKIPINNIGCNRASINREHLITALQSVVYQDYNALPRENPGYIAYRILENIKFKVANGVTWLEEACGNILCNFNTYSSPPATFSDFHIDGYELLRIIRQMSDEEISFLMPRYTGNGLVIEGDKCQYILLQLCNGDEETSKVYNQELLHLEPIKKVVFSSDSVDPKMEITMMEVPIHQHDLSALYTIPREYVFNTEADDISAYEDYEELLENAEKLIEDLKMILTDCIFERICKDSVGSVIDKFEKDLNSHLGLVGTGIEFGVDFMKDYNLLIRRGLLLRSRLLQDHLKIKPMYQMEMSFH